MTTTVALTVGEIRRRVARRLDAAFRAGRRATNAALDARIIVAHVLGVAANDVVMIDDRDAGGGTEAAAMALAERRIAGEPVARLVGRKEFWGLDFVLSPATLVPRPDTETVVSAALEAIDRDGMRNAPLSILDLGTGSGAILVALLSELPSATGIGTDLSAEAVASAAENARRFGLRDRARFVVGDWAAPVEGRFDLVVSNPPYIRRDDIDGLEVEVRLHDPQLGLDGGMDGLDAYRVLIGKLAGLIAPRGRAVFEIGIGQAEAVAAIAIENGWKSLFHEDIAGLVRAVRFERAVR